MGKYFSADVHGKKEVEFVVNIRRRFNTRVHHGIPTTLENHFEFDKPWIYLRWIATIEQEWSWESQCRWAKNVSPKHQIEQFDKPKIKGRPQATLLGAADLLDIRPCKASILQQTLLGYTGHFNLDMSKEHRNPDFICRLPHNSTEVTWTQTFSFSC